MENKIWQQPKRQKLYFINYSKKKKKKTYINIAIKKKKNNIHNLVGCS